MSDATEDNALGEQSESVRLRYVPLPLAGNRRHQWKTLLVLTALSKCRNNSATVAQLHTLTWALSDERNAETVMRAWSSPSLRMVRGYVPDLLRTLKVMQIEKLILQDNSGRQRISDSGKALLDQFIEREGRIGVAETLLNEAGKFSAAEMARKLGGSFS